MNAPAPLWNAVIPPARRAFLPALLLASLLAPAAEAKSISAPAGKPGKPVTHGKRAAAAATAGVSLSAAEKRVATAVDQGAPASLALLEAAVNVNSGTMNFEGVRQVASLFEPQLVALGFTTRWVDGAAWGRAGDLIARRIPGEASAAAAASPERGRPGVREVHAPKAATPRNLPKLLLIGHLDTVFEKSSPFQRFERSSDSTARGPGVCDMKGGDVVMLLALRALKQAGLLDRMAVTVYLGGDEEKEGRPHAVSRRDLREAAEWADVAIGFEDGPGDPRVAVVARRGASSWRLDVTGKPYHSGQIFREDVGPGAVFECARILEAFRDSLSTQAFLTFSPGVILGGTEVGYDSLANRGTAFGKTNVIAEHATVVGDLRSISPAQLESARATMQRIAAANLPHTSATLVFDDGYPPLTPSDGNRRLLAMYDKASRDLGLGGVGESDPSRAGAADVSFCDGLVDMALDGVGLMGDGGHTVDETANLRTLPTQAKRMAVALARLAEGWGK